MCFVPFRRLNLTQYQPLSTSDTTPATTTTTTSTEIYPAYQKNARLFVQKFNLKYGSKHPTFFVGEAINEDAGKKYENVFYELMDKAKKDYKLMLVYLHSDQHQNTAQFCQYVPSSYFSFLKEMSCAQIHSQNL